MHHHDMAAIGAKDKRIKKEKSMTNEFMLSFEQILNLGKPQETYV